MICIFDIETIPDTALLQKIYDFKGSPKEVAQQALKEQEAKSSSSFLPLPFHSIVTISAVIADEYGIYERVSSMDGKNEEELIGTFLKFLDSHQPKLVSFNGRSFDMPLLMIRALKYNLTCKAYFEVENRELNKNKWENYRSRYSDRFHVDLMDHISEFGAARGLKLDHLCSMSNLPGKYDVSGDQVMELFFDNKLEKIKEYCESDVLNTYWLFLKYEILRNNLTLEDYQRALLKMDEKMDKNRAYTPVFKEYIKDELARFKS